MKHSYVFGKLLLVASMSGLLSMAGANANPASSSPANSSANVSATPVVNTNITETEVLAAQKGWGEALVAISREGAKSAKKATELARKVIDEAYGYDIGPVLFKPTLTTGEQTFRTTKEGALAYFVGGNKAFSGETGFALKGWEKVEIMNKAIHINGDLALTMGNVKLTDKAGKQTVVDKTWGFKKTDKGQLKIVLHHSSLPYTP